ncbi:bifunctional UDP-sugar hydrolase/5'-nucleotidase [Afifella sp. IM 167]|uniref:bifunctional metallophosphatase/5'-nucleotidase n=1 Tax=Afifella sp. IM 167 TaxID=2033586 RepID=UPI001CCAB4AB|nr:5'-nucleotidase C-terminal domain-containing protein [Afifella sp. IM 167]MBZ8132740.1 bifunctional metallophosphatase/5'-nucleotidase [Afifella sp. IM 167]
MLRCFAAFAVALLVLVQPSPSRAETVPVTFLLVNDADQMAGSDEVRGGYARIAAVAKEERAKGGHVFLVHAGDAISPSLMAGFDRGQHIITLLNMVKPDIFVPGNHEYDFGEDIFRTRFAEAEFPVLAANLSGADGKPVGSIRPSVMLEVEGAKIGVVGLTAEDSYVKSSPGALKIGPSLEAGKREAEALRQKGADFVVAVAHAGRALDQELFRSRAFDLILSGDDHDLMVFFDGKTAMAESKEQGEFVTAVDVMLSIQEEDGKRKVSWWPGFRPIDTAGVVPDAEVQAKIDEFQADLSKELDVTVGKTTTPLDSRRPAVRTAEAAIGNLIADAMRLAVKADVAVTNGGGIRGNRVYDAGTQLSRRDILTELPFGNRTVKLEISGAGILKALENGFSKVEEGAGRFPQVSGMVVEVDLQKPAGSRVVAVQISGEELDPQKTYTLATNDFMARGGDGYEAFAAAKPILNERDGKLMASDVMSFIRAAGEVAPKPEGRIRVKG